MPMSKVRRALNLRIQPELRGLIDQAALIKGKNRTDFILDAARTAAEDALLDRTVFVMGKDAYAAFVARLDAPAQPNEKLKKLLETSPLWK